MKLQNRDVTPKISAITPVALEATTAVAQTLTCNIGNVTTAAEVSWRDGEGGEIEHNEGGYTVNKGSVNSDNVQISTLIIAPATLQNLDTSSPVTYQCSAKSSQYPESEASPYQDLVVTFLSFCKFFNGSSQIEVSLSES